MLYSTKVEFLDDKEIVPEAIITVWKQGLFSYLLGLGRFKKIQYRGRVTVWRYLDTGVRCRSSLEAELCDIWKKANWDRKDAIAKLKGNNNAIHP